MAFEVSKVRDCYPALADGYAYLDGAAGTQIPTAVIDAIAGAYRGRPVERRRSVPGQRPGGSRSPADCRAAVADLVGGEPDGVVLGPNMTTLTYRLAAALADTWAEGTR